MAQLDESFCIAGDRASISPRGMQCYPITETGVKLVVWKAQLNVRNVILLNSSSLNSILILMLSI